MLLFKKIIKKYILIIKLIIKKMIKLYLHNKMIIKKINIFKFNRN